AISDHGTTPIQTITNVHPRRDRRRARPLTHAPHRLALPHGLPRRAVRRRLARGGPPHERERPLSYAFPDGTSVVERTAQPSRSSLYVNGHAEREEGWLAPRGARRGA